jgi:hypothetical protein
MSPHVPFSLVTLCMFVIRHYPLFFLLVFITLLFLSGKQYFNTCYLQALIYFVRLFSTPELFLALLSIVEYAIPIIQLPIRPTFSLLLLVILGRSVLFALFT